MKNKNSNNQVVLPKDQIDAVISLYSNGHIQEAIAKIQTLNQQYPNVPVLFNILGACYKSLGQLENASKMFKNAFTLQPKYAEAHFNHGVVLRAMGELVLALESYKNAIVLLPNYPDAHNNLGNVFRDLGRPEEAIECYEWAVAYRPEFAEAHNNLGIVQSDMGQLNLSLKSYEKAISINSDYVDALFNQAITNKQLGNKSLSIKTFERVLELSPDYASAYRNLSEVKYYKKNDQQIAKMEQLISKKNLSQSDLISLNLALSKVYEDLGDRDKQFKFLKKGNDQRKKELNYSFDQSLRLHLSIKEFFKSPLTPVKKSSYNVLKFRPVFIVGMPRSGTSLVEQIVSSHHEVHGAGELEYFSPILSSILTKRSAEVTDKDILSIRDQYLSKVLSLKFKQGIMTDKMPANFRYIGFILSAFPEAKIIHLKRDARATCWSIYKYYFSDIGNGWAYNFKDLAVFYNLYS
ncbi:tetratricopeptide repeat protein, partial [Candidatus Thioglobus sp.]|nr:tetratricopeptide repeat protein [Candidatus Thioglobus sp.]